jgi:Ras-related protein Rab-22
MEGNDITCKVVLVGDTGVGKTCIIQRYVNDSYKEENDSTITSSYTFKKINYPKYKKSISFDIWDTAGQELYRSLAKNFYLNASIGILVYDVRRKKSFESIQNYWYEELKQSGEDNMVIAVAGNKCDLFNQEEVTEEEAKKYAKEIGAVFFLTSCKESIGIDELFEKCGEKYLENNKLINKGEQKDNNKFGLDNKEVNGKNKGKKKGSCC